MKVTVLAGVIWRECNLTPVAEGVPATPEAVAKAAGVNIDVARRALIRAEDDDGEVLAGWVNPITMAIVPSPPEGAEEVGQSRHGDFVYEDKDGEIWEPFYIAVVSGGVHYDI